VDLHAGVRVSVRVRGWWGWRGCGRRSWRARTRVARVGCLACAGVVGVCRRRRAQVPGLHRAGMYGWRGRGSYVDRLRGCG